MTEEKVPSTTPALSQSELQALVACEGGRFSTEELAERLETTEEKARSILKQMEGKGLITRIKLVKTVWITTFDGRDALYRRQ